jgi:hypothetical protein
LGYQG